MKWMLTDCFDTLLLRKYSPSTVKRRWSQDVSSSLHYALPCQKIYEIRELSESVMPPYYSYHDLCEEMIRRIGCCIPSDVVLPEQFNDIMYRLELKNEIEGLQVNEEHLQLLRDGSVQKAVVSDMYCGEAFIRELLKAFEIDQYIDRVFVSCDYKAGKVDLTHSLYKAVLEELHISPEDAVMYDDTEMCCYCANQCDIKAIRVKKGLYNPKADDRRVAEKEIVKALQTKYSSVASLTNYVAAFYLFTERLYRECVREGVEKIFFLSREGEFLKKLFDQYSLNRANHVETEYLYVSRRAVLSASFGEDPLSPGDRVKKAYRFTSIANILQNVGFSNEEIEQIRRSYEVDLDIRLENYWECDEWRWLCQDLQFNERYRCYAKKKREVFASYLQQVGFLENRRSAIVDVGWKGTMQDALRAFVPDSKPLIGYYFGITEFAKNSPDNLKKGLIFSAGDVRSKDYEMWSFYHTQTESVLTASHAGVFSHHLSEDGRVNPVFQDWGSEQNSYEMMFPLQEKILEKFQYIDTVLEQHGFEGEDFYRLFLTTHIQTLLTFGRAKSVFLRQLQYNQIDNLVSGKSNSTDMVHSYNLMQNFKRIFRNLDTLRNPVRMIRILQTNNLHFLIPVVICKVKKQFLRQIKYRSYKV